MASKTPKLVIALDIGTTHSGYAWQSRDDFESNPSKVGLYNWKAALIKTSTAILFSSYKNKTVDSIGFVAEERYAEHGAKPENNNDWRLFKNFKMVLYGEQFSEYAIVEDVESVEHAPLKCVMTEYIKELKTHFIEDSKRRGQDILPDEDIRWVVTVPAIWNDGARNFMKKCVEAAIGPPDSKKHQHGPDVLIALEPEAAAIYCLHLSVEERHAMGGLGKTGDSFLLADLGGGTADISVQKVADDGKFEQLCVPDGERIGGEDINNAFILACKEEFRGNSWFEAWQSLSQEQNLRADHRLRQDFEMRKVEIMRDASPADEWVRVRLPKPLEKLLNDGTGNGPLRLDKNGEVFKIDDGEFYFNGKLVRETLFKTTASYIFSILKRVLKKENVSSVEKVVLVGGLSESGIVIDNMKNRLKETFKERKIAVYVPKLPMQAVLTGAVLFGHDPEIFKIRVSKYTYGIQTNSRFDPASHAESKKFQAEGVDYCKDVFDVHFTKNQKVKLNDRLPVSPYYPLYKSQTEVKLPIYVSSKKKPKYTDEAKCKHLADILVALPDKSTKKVSVSMIYGGTVIRVEAVEKSTGKLYDVEIKYQTIEGFEKETTA